MLLRLADHIFSFENRYRYIERIAADYITDGEPEVTISVTDDDIAQEQENTEETFPNGYLEGLAFLRKASYWLCERGIILFHGVLLSFDGRGVIFTAPSGTGKSTHARQWIEHFGPERAVIINGDKPFVRITDDGRIIAYGTPWCGKEYIQVPKSVEVSAIAVVRQSPVDEIRQIPKEQAFPLIFRQALVPERFDLRMIATTKASTLCSLPIYDLGCTISHHAAALAANVIFGEKL